MPRYSISNVPTEVIGLYAGSGVFRGRLGDIEPPSTIYTSYLNLGARSRHFNKTGHVLSLTVRSLLIILLASSD